MEVPQKLRGFQSIKEVIKDKGEVLSVLESCLDYSNPTSIQNLIPNTDSDIQVIIQIKSKLYTKVCVNCQATGKIYDPGCGHKYCLDCSKEIIIENRKCFKCDSGLSHNFELKLINVLKKADEKSINILCKKCKIAEILHTFEGKCNHLCLNCVQTSYETFEHDCIECFQALFNDSKYFEHTEMCYGCSEKKYFIGDFMSLLPCKHLYCIECIENSIRTKRCKYCAERINQSQLLDCLIKCTHQCNSCNSIFSKTFISLKTCCKKYLCGNCERHHKCKPIFT